MSYQTLDDFVGKTPLVALQRLNPNSNVKILAKLEGNNPAGSVKDRPALNMIMDAEKRGLIKAGDRLIEATSGNTGIALAMVSAMRGYKLTLIMPADMSEERRTTMAVYGAEIITPSGDAGMEECRDLALQMQQDGKGLVLNQFANAANPEAHYLTTGPEIWQASNGEITHFVSSMGTTGTIMGVSRFMREQASPVKIVGVQPTDGSKIPGIRRWPQAYLPEIYQPQLVDEVVDVSQLEAEDTAQRLALEEGIFAGVSSGGAVCAAIKIAQQLTSGTIVVIICDRGDRYLSTGVFTSAKS